MRTKPNHLPAIFSYIHQIRVGEYESLEQRYGWSDRSMLTSRFTWLFYLFIYLFICSHCVLRARQLAVRRHLGVLHTVDLRRYAGPRSKVNRPIKTLANICHLFIAFTALMCSKTLLVEPRWAVLIRIESLNSEVPTWHSVNSFNSICWCFLVFFFFLCNEVSLFDHFVADWFV